MTVPPQLPPPSPFPATRNHDSATTALILGVLGITMVPGLGIVAWILGSKAIADMDAQPQVVWGNRDHATIGRILGIIGTVLVIAILLFIVVYVVFMLVFFGLFLSTAGG